MQSDFLRLVGAANESFRLIIMYYMFKCWFGLRRTLLGSLQSQKSPVRLDFGETSYNDFFLARSDFEGLLELQMSP